MSAIQEAIKDAEIGSKYPQLVLITGSPGNEESIISGIQEVIGWGIPIIGGSAASNTAFDQTWREFANDKVYSNGVALTAVFTELEISYAYESGYDVQEEEGVITRSEGRLIYEIDGKPAAEVFNTWCDGCLDEKLETGGITIPKSASWTLSKVVNSEKENYYLSFAIIGVGQNKSLISLAEVSPGDKVLVTRGYPQSFLEKIKKTAKRAMEKNGLKRGEALFGISTSCAGLQISTPEDDRTKIPLVISEEIGEGVPFIGTFTFGEEGPLGLVNYHGNYINSIILFSRNKG